MEKNNFKLVPVKECTLEEVRAGAIFGYKRFGSPITMCVKTEYRVPENGAIEAFILDSGEFFVGGELNPSARAKLMVTQYELLEIND